MKNKGPLYVLTCYVIWGLLPIFWKLLAQVDSLYVLASRIVWSMVLTGGILLLRRDRLAGVRAAFRDRREWGCWPLRAAWSASTGASTSGRWPTGT